MLYYIVVICFMKLTQVGADSWEDSRKESRRNREVLDNETWRRICKQKKRAQEKQFLMLCLAISFINVGRKFEFGFLFLFFSLLFVCIFHLHLSFPFPSILPIYVTRYGSCHLTCLANFIHQKLLCLTSWNSSSLTDTFVSIHNQKPKDKDNCNRRIWELN